MQSPKKASIPVRKAVITAAGYGTRFLPATKSLAKEMFPIVDKPAIQYLVEEAVASGIKEILIITSRGRGAIEDHFDRNPELNEHLIAHGRKDLVEELEKLENLAEILYARQKDCRGLGHAVLCAERFVGNEPFALMLGDDLVKGKIPCLRELIEVHEKFNSSVVAVSRVKAEETRNYGIAIAKEYGKTFLAEGFVEKPQSNPPSDYAILGRYILMPEIFPELRRTPFGRNNELQVTDAINSLCKNGSVYAHEISGKWLTVGNKADYLKAILSYAVERKDLGDFREFLKDLAKTN
ncbi:MAG: UTP--glucose-1-phosphate uridylyltransferase [archaeon]